MSSLGNVIRTGSRKIYGVLAPPRVSRNNNFYTPETLMAGDGLKVPLYDQHEDFEIGRNGKPTGRILAKEARGQVSLIWNKLLQRLEYIGEVWDKGLQKLISAGARPHVSLAAEPRHFEQYRGMNVPLDMQFFSVAAVQHPGIPEATLNMEWYMDQVAPIALESANGTAQMILLEFDTVAFEMQTEHDFDAAIAALQAMDAQIDAAKQNPEIYQGDKNQMGAPSTMDDEQKEIYHDTQVPASPSSQIWEPLSHDAQQMKQGMQQTYDDPEKANQVFYATMNKRGLDDSQPFDKQNAMPPDPRFPEPQGTDGQAMEPAPFMSIHHMPLTGQHQPVPPPQLPAQTSPQQIPQGYSNLTPMRGMANMRSGLTGVTGTGNITPMQGTGINQSRGMPEPVVRPQVSPTGMNQQILPRNPVQGTMDNYNAVGTGVSRDSPVNMNPTSMPRQQMASTREDQGAEPNVSRGNAQSATPKAYGLTPGTMSQPDKPDLSNAHDVTVKGIGQTDNTVGTSFEGTKLGGKGGDAGDNHNNPNRYPTITTHTREEEEKQKEEEEEEEIKEAAQYGFSKEEFLDMKSTYNPAKWKSAWESFKMVARMSPTLRESIRRKRIESSGVMNQTLISQQRESREGGRDVMNTGRAFDKFNVRAGLTREILDKHLDVLDAKSNSSSNYYRSFIPALNPPGITRHDGIGPRLEFADELEGWANYQNEQRNVALEAIATTTTGTAMAIDGAVPALIVPTNLAGMLRDTVYYQQIQQGSNTVYFQTLSVPAAGALTENAQPSDATQTLTRVSVVPTPRGVGQPISFEAERKVLGPILEGVILTFRVSELYDEDNLLIGSGNAFESATLPSTGGPFITGGSTSATGNVVYGAGRANEAAIATADVMSYQYIQAIITAATLQGYSPDNYVCVMNPKQYGDLLKDTTYLNRLVSFGPNTTPGTSWIAQGVIPEVGGVEIRRSTLMKTGTGTSSQTTYHAWGYKKGLSAGLAASRDLMIETYRNILLNNTYVKAHWDFAYAVLQPNSVVELLTS